MEPTEAQKAVPALWLSIRARKAHAFLAKEAREGRPQSSLCGQVKEPTDDRWRAPPFGGLDRCRFCARRLTELRVRAAIQERR